jgi:exosortase/archaeosortase family protein
VDKLISGQMVRSDRTLVWVAVRFAAYFLLFDTLIIGIDLLGGWHTMLLWWTAVSAGIAHGFGIGGIQDGTRITIGSRVLSVDLACSAIFIVALFVALVLAYPVSAKTRLLGVALGVPVILAANLVRLVAAQAVQAWAPGAFTFLHEYLFQVGMVFVTMAAWAVWLSVARRNAR